MAKLLTPYAFAKKHGINQNTLKYWIKIGRVPVVRKTVEVEKIFIREDLKIK